jgi:hypothetical protein
MRLPNFTYRYNVMVNGRYSTRWFTTRDEARAYRRELSSSSTNSVNYNIIRQPVSYGDDSTVR